MDRELTISRYLPIRYGVISRIKDVLSVAQQSNLEVDLILFGSCAWGFATYMSDIDILVLTNGDISEEYKYLFRQIEDKYEQLMLPIHFTFRDFNIFKNSNERFECQIKAGGFLLYANGLFKNSN